ncbi:hypothetical protein FOMPIDRAFT_1056404 [Fomitopsis schrenkii]|uniref:Uncharacterized protein n=1 Tax=Fomitopsis schrenkii TaxID=2126942 RepID=S8DHE4_FOMSC|nr:hypothetical protein FOMPIDRAFT_1056404 [Fomitopsis schrenkii]
MDLTNQNVVLTCAVLDVTDHVPHDGMHLEVLSRVRRIVGDGVVTLLVAPSETTDVFEVLPYDDPTGVGDHGIDLGTDVVAFQVSMSDLDDQVSQQQNVDVWADLAHLTARSDVATVDPHNTSDDIYGSDSTSTPHDINGSDSTSTSDDIDGSDSDSIATVLSYEVDVLGEHRVIIMYPCNFEKEMEKLAPAVVRYITSYPSEMEGATEVYVVRVPLIIGGYWSIRLFVRTQVAGVTQSFTTSPPLAVFRFRAPLDETTLRGKTEDTPLKLNNLAEFNATLGSVAGLALARTDAEGHQQTQDRQGEDVLQGISIRPTDGKQKHSQDFSIEQAERNKCLTPVLRTLFNEAIITMKFG